MDADAPHRRFWLGFVSSAREHVDSSAADHEQSARRLARRRLFDSRPRGRAEDALGEVLLEINALGETLRMQRLGAFEATALLRTIMAEIDVAVFTFDPDRRLRLVNRAGENLLGRPIDKLLGRRASELGLAVCLDANEDAPLTLTFPGGSGRWGFGEAPFASAGFPMSSRSDRPEPDAARRRTQRLAAARARPRSRDEQLARPDQIDRGQSGDFDPARSAAARLARRCTQRIECDRHPRGIAQPIHASLRATGSPSAAAKGDDRSW